MSLVSMMKGDLLLLEVATSRRSARCRPCGVCPAQGRKQHEKLHHTAHARAGRGQAPSLVLKRKDLFVAPLRHVGAIVVHHEECRISRSGCHGEVLVLFLWRRRVALLRPIRWRKRFLAHEAVRELALKWVNIVQPLREEAPM